MGYTYIRNLQPVLKEPEVTSEINKLPEAIHNHCTHSTNSPGPGSVFIQSTLIVSYVTGFG